MPSADALRALNARLDLPARKRPDLLREVLGDVEALVDRLVSEGVPREQAELRAVALLSPGTEAAAALAELHRAPLPRMALWLGMGRGTLLETVPALAMGALTLSALLGTVLAAGGMPLWQVVPLGILGALLVANALREGARWWLGGEGEAAALAFATRVQAGGAALAMIWASLASVWVAYRAAEGWSRTPPAAGEVVAVLAGAFTLHALALAVAILGVFGGLALVQALTAAREVEAQLEGLFDEADLDEGRSRR